MKNLYALLSISILLLLNACSDYASDIKDEYQDQLAAGIIECDKHLEGTQISTIDGGDRICKDGSWNPVISDHPKSSSSNTTTHLSSSTKISSSSVAKSSSSIKNSSSSITQSSSSKTLSSSSVTRSSSSTKNSSSSITQSSSSKTLSSSSATRSSSSTKNSSSSIVRSSSSEKILSSSSSVQESSSSAVSALYLCPDGNYAVDYENCEKKECKTYSEDLVCLEDIVKTLGECTEDIEDSIGKTSQTFFKCSNNAWIRASITEIDTYRLEPGKDGDTKYGEIYKVNCYVYESDPTNSGWRLGENIDCKLKLGGCTTVRQGTSTQDENGQRYVCVNRQWKNGNTFSWDIPKSAYLNPNVEYNSLIDERDGKVYKTVEIGFQEWMAENLNYYDLEALPSLKNYSYCYGNIDSLCDIAGRFYNGNAIAYDICPSGWHVPSRNEYNELMDFIGNNVDALKSSIGWSSGDYNNRYGFSSVPFGAMSYWGDWINIYDGDSYQQNISLYWLADEYGNGYDYIRIAGRIDVDTDSRNAYPIRCIKNNPLTETCEAENSVTKEGNAFYICHSSKWEKTDWATYTYGACTSHKENEIEKGPIGGVYYMCSEGAWIKTPYSYGNCNTSRENELVSFENDFYLCKNETWEPVTQLEYENGICTLEIEGKIASISSSREGYYTCTNEKWEYINTCPTDKEEGETFFLDGCHSCRCSKGALVCRGC